MRRFVAAVFAVLACSLLAAEARAVRVTSFNDPPDAGPRVLDVHLTFFGTFASPRGDFGSTSSDHPAFAMPGAGAGLEISGRYRHEIEAGGVLVVDRNSTDSHAIGAAFATELRGYGLPSDPLVLSATSWSTAWILGKVGYAPRLGKHLRGFVDLYGGGLYAGDPVVKLVASPPQLSISVKQVVWSHAGLAAGAGAGVRYGDHLTLGLLYLSSSVWPVKSSDPDVAEQQNRLSILHATLGYAFRL